MTTVAALLSRAAHPDAARILAHVLQCDRAWLVAHAESKPSEEQIRRFEALHDRRCSGVPLAYIIGSAGFYGREFLVNEDVLVPRPETEHLVDEALEFIHGPMRVLDVGTGSGAIACTIAAESQGCVDAVDASAAAIAIAQKNARRLGVSERCIFYHGDLIAPVATNRYDVIIANLPYIPTADLPKPPDPVSFEPRLATDGGPDGLFLYRRLVPNLPKNIREGGLILLEAAPPTINTLASMLQSTLLDFTISVEKDYAGLARYVKAVCNGPSGLHTG